MEGVDGSASFVEIDDLVVIVDDVVDIVCDRRDLDATFDKIWKAKGSDFNEFIITRNGVRLNERLKGGNKTLSEKDGSI